MALADRSALLARFLERLSEEAPDRSLLGDALDGVASELDCERVFLFQLRARGGFRVLLGRSRHGESLSTAASRLSHYAIRRMVEGGEELFVANARRDRRYRPEEVLEGRRAPVSILVVPIRAGARILGGLYADHRFHALRYDRPRAEGTRAWAAAFGVALRLRGLARRVRKAGLGRAGGREPPKGALIESLLTRPEGEGVVSFHGMVTANPDLKDVFEAIESLESSDLPVLISGATGTGKSLLASAVHECSARRGRPFVSLSPAAVPDSLVESELLGFVRGAFTGAEADHQGYFAMSDGGTLHLDEIADAGLELQKKLLRVLEDGHVRPLGAKASIHVDVRFLASTSRDLEKMVRLGRFRKDLYYRLKGVVLEIPPLSERREDVLPLAVHFLRKHAASERRDPPALSESARRLLLGHDWPGNVRELESEMRRLVALGLSTVAAEQLAPSLGGRGRHAGGAGSEASRLRPLSEAAEQAEREAIQAALRAGEGNKSFAARALGITRKALYRRLLKYGIG